MATAHYGPARERRKRGDLALVAVATRELEEALPCRLVGPERCAAGNVTADLLGHRLDFLFDPRLVFGRAEQHLDPGLGAVVRLDVVVDQQFAEDEADT